MNTTRRNVLRTAAAFSLVFRLPELHAADPEPAVFSPNAYLQITDDGTVTLWATHLEMGQGVRTLLPMILAEELEADRSRVRVEQASPGDRFKAIRLHTSGSGSSSGSYRTLRIAGAAAKEMLIAAAASDWNVEPRSCAARLGEVIHTETNRRRAFGTLVVSASAQPVPRSPALKKPADFTVLGKPIKRVDGPAIVTGRAQYGMDIRIPGMLYASIEHAPTLGGTLVQFDAEAAHKVPGVRNVVAVTSGIHPGVAVVADDNWAAMKGREALRVEWATDRHASFDSESFLQDLWRSPDHTTFSVRHEGAATEALASAHARHEASYMWPFQAHAAMETMNCTARVTAEAVEVWAPTQTDVRTLAQLKKVTGLPDSATTLHCTLMGGGFGRRLFADYAAEAAEISEAIGKTVQVTWSREDDMKFGYYQPATVERFTAGLDQSGSPTALIHKTTASDLTIYDIHDGRNIWTAARNPKALDAYSSDQSPWGAYDNPYEFPHLSVDCADVTSPVPTGPWRAVQYPSTVFGRESFLDELAHLAKKDPIDYRLNLLPEGIKTVGPYKIDRGRFRRVLQQARSRSKWGELPDIKPGRRTGRGIAANVFHAGSYMAMIAEVSVAADGTDLRVHRITTVIDCGIALNPLGIIGQTESGITWGLSATVLGKVDFKKGAVVQSNFSDFQVLRLSAMPELNTVILDSGAEPGGFGEHPVAPVAPAVANALFAASGNRLRELPLRTAKSHVSPGPSRR